jgi:hypothetical protein
MCGADEIESHMVARSTELIVARRNLAANWIYRHPACSNASAPLRNTDDTQRVLYVQRFRSKQGRYHHAFEVVSHR